MQIQLAKKYGFCFGVQRAIEIATSNKGAKTIGPLIHNPKEINRLKKEFFIQSIEDIEEENLEEQGSVIIRTHGIPKDILHKLQKSKRDIIDATCPFVTKPQIICEEMTKKNYQVIIFGDDDHPEVIGVKSYGDSSIVVSGVEDLKKHILKRKIALISQTTKKIAKYQEVINFLIKGSYELRVFNTICNATFENQDAAYELSSNVDIMIILGGKNSSNTKQFFELCKKNCQDSYLVEDKNELNKQWFDNKNICGITAGASTPKWVIDESIKVIQSFKTN